MFEKLQVAGIGTGSRIENLNKTFEPILKEIGIKLREKIDFKK